MLSFSLRWKRPPQRSKKKTTKDHQLQRHSVKTRYEGGLLRFCCGPFCPCRDQKGETHWWPNHKRARKWSGEATGKKRREKRTSQHIKWKLFTRQKTLHRRANFGPHCNQCHRLRMHVDVDGRYFWGGGKGGGKSVDTAPKPIQQKYQISWQLKLCLILSAVSRRRHRHHQMGWQPNGSDNMCNHSRLR